ncbi:MAG TPA: hypothetical protein VH025_02570 [Solirubrobacteraceae bacterium]|jgi:FkbH-like protein|nr:hypothetical protein [Solirubrobacteraceae bacterium]
MDSDARTAEEPAQGVAASASTTRLGDPLKLVIWDLDEVLWSGTLSEGEVVLDPAHAEIVRTLNRRGIVNSICSKNDLEAVRTRLEREGLWDEFVFASVSWSPKGRRVAQIVEDMQLRPTNVLFIDDNIGNVQEALHFSPTLQTAEPDVIDQLLKLPQCVGKDDSALTRLAQYKVLETKAVDRAATSTSNEEFLRSCAIRVQLTSVHEEGDERVLELVNRSNQLNFTKTRLTSEQLGALLAGEGRETSCVRVADRYGEYGMCGFYSVKDGDLSDFVFSCRILHMGVEQWLYERLGRPQLQVVGDVAATLEGSEHVDWITLDDGTAAALARTPSATALPKASSARVLLKGGCDMWILNSFLGGSIRTEFTYPSATGAEVHSDHIEVLKRAAGDTLAQHGEVIDRLPFVDRAAYHSRIMRSPKSIGTLVYSVLMEYTQGIYRLRGTDYVVPYEQHDIDVTDRANWEYLEKRWGEVGVDRVFLEWFAENFDFEGQLSEDAFKENIRWLAEHLPNSRVILINGAEVPIEHKIEKGRHLHHERMNRALEAVVAELPNAAICDVRPFISSREDLKDNLRHYTRETYLHMAESLQALLGKDVAVERRPLVSKIYRARRRLERNLDRVITRLRVR